MAAFFLLLASLMMIGVGLWRLTASLDDLWQRQERQLLARGLAPHRSNSWEQNVRRSGWLCIVSGVLFLVSFAAKMASRPQVLPRMSGFSINGRTLTQEEWDACGHDTLKCVQMEGLKRR